MCVLVHVCVRKFTIYLQTLTSISAVQQTLKIMQKNAISLTLCAVCSAVLLLALAVSSCEGQAECPCKNHTLCQPLSTKPYKEVLAFVVNKVGLYIYT